MQHRLRIGQGAVQEDVEQQIEELVAAFPGAQVGGGGQLQQVVTDSAEPGLAVMLRVVGQPAVGLSRAWSRPK